MQKILMLAVLFFSMTACAGNQAETSKEGVENAQNEVEIIEITILKFKFVPEVLEIKSGQTVRWMNREKRQYHSVWFEKYGEEESEYLFPDEYLDKKFDKPGEYEYLCGPHPKMIGKIIVK